MYPCNDVPVVELVILNKTGMVILDSEATHCLASPAFYNILLSNGNKFTEFERTFSLADGSVKVHKVIQHNGNVKLQDRAVHTRFPALPYLLP